MLNRLIISAGGETVQQVVDDVFVLPNMSVHGNLKMRKYI